VVAGVAGVEQHEHGARTVDVLAYLLDDLGARRASLEQGDQGAQRVRLDRRAVVWADLDVDADHPAVVHDLAEAGREHQ